MSDSKDVDPREKLEQQLLELVYELLPNEEAAALNERITSDPDVARAYAKVKLQADLLQQAARFTSAPVKLQPPKSAAAPAATDSDSLPQPAPARPDESKRRAINWFVGLAAAGLICLMGYFYLQPGSPVNPASVETARQRLAGDHVRLTVTGPERLHADATSYFTVATQTAAGQPASVPVEYVVYSPEGELLQEQGTTTDEQGCLQIELPSALRLRTHARLEVFAAGGPEGHSRIQLPLSVEQPRFVTHLSFDKPLYRPGETVRFRSLTLSRFGLQPEREIPLHFEILDPAGTTLPESAQDGVTQRGVGNGQFPIGGHLPGGTYTLVVRGLDNSFAEDRREFSVRRYRTPRLKKELELTRDSYAPGDLVEADFSAARAEGGPAAGAQLTIRVTVDGQQVSVDQPSTQADSAGAHRIQFNLPDEITEGNGTLAVVVDDGGTRETIAKTIPINLGKVDVRFYPEGGDLVAGLSNRVYFHATDPLGKPVEIAAGLVDEDGEELTRVETIKEGRGAFRFTPQAQQVYRLKISSPPGVSSEPELPRTTVGRWLVMDTGKGVFAAQEPIELDVLAAKHGVPLLATAVCRGVPAGRTEFVARSKVRVTSPKDRRTSVTVPIAPEAAGVVRVTVYDASQLQPQPIAERLVYRRSARQLKVELADAGRDRSSYSPGEPVKLTLQVSDETGDPVPAALGVAVVDDALVNLADDKSPTMTTHFLLATEIEKPEDLEDANFFLSDDPEADEALDLLLGTQGWRRFAELSLAELGELAKAEAQTADGVSDELKDRKQALTRLVALEGEDRPPVARDNAAEVDERFSAALAAFGRQRAAATSWFGWTVLLVGAALLGVLTLTGALRVAGDARVWVPAVAVAAISCLVGITWMGAEPAGDGQIAFRTWSQFGDGGRAVARLDSELDGEQAQTPQGEGDDSQRSEETSLARRLTELATVRSGLVQSEREAILAMEAAQGNVIAIPDAVAFDAEHLRLYADRGDFFGNFANAKALGDFDGEDQLALEGGRRAADGWFARQFDGEEARGKRFDEYARNFRGGAYAFIAPAKNLAGQQIEGLDLLLDAKERYQNFLEQHRFTVRTYAHQHVAGPPGVRTDFTETLYWHPLLIADEDGRAGIEFELSDSVTTFRVRADAHGGGRIGSGGGEIVSRIPFSLEPKLPLEVTAGDRIDLPVAVNNDTQDPLPVSLTFQAGELLQLAGDASREVSLDAASRHREFFTLDVVGEKGEAEIEVRGQAGNLADAVRKPLRVVPPGFPVSDSYAGRLTEDQTLVIPMPDDWVGGSLEVKLEAFPSSLADLQKGLDSILREPSGCFEQTSTSNYPNVLSLLYMQEHDVAAPEVTRRAKELLKKGYGRLTSFECPEKGYEWFGGDPGHEALTAYGLLQFRDMTAVWDVDQQMVARTSKWLMDRRDGQGGFKRNSRALDSFGRAPQQITDAYIVWALAEAEQEDIDKEVKHVISVAQKSEDPYLIALAAAAAMSTERKTVGAELLDKLAKYQKEDGHLEAVEGTITRSGGLSMQMETTALAAMAWLKEPRMRQNADKAVEWIGNHRQGSGGFGSTQATILALKALIEHAKANRATVSSGALYVKRGDDEVSRTEFGAGETKTIVVGGLEAQIQPGENELTIGLTGDNEMPFVVDVSYRTHKLASDENCPVRLKTSLAEEKVSAGATVGATVELTNISGKGQPMTVAIVGLPAGLEARVDQLDEMKDAGKYDYYEINARELIFYWRSLSPEANEADPIRFTLDLVAEIPGRYTAPASRAYLYYTAEQKHWVDPLKVEIARQ